METMGQLVTRSALVSRVKRLFFVEGTFSITAGRSIPAMSMRRSKGAVSCGRVFMMSTQRLFVVAGVMSLMSAGAANASTVDPILVDGTYKVSYYDTTGSKPTISDDLSRSFKEDLNPGVPTAEVDFFTASPAGSSRIACGGHKEPQCDSTNDIATGTITVTFTFDELGGSKDETLLATGSLTVTGTYEANYDGTLTCSTSTGKETDCIDWSLGMKGTDVTDGVLYPVDLSNGNLLDVILYDAQDWDITPKISFDLDPKPTPLPASLPLFAGGAAVVGLVARRRKKKSAAGVVRWRGCFGGLLGSARKARRFAPNVGGGVGPTSRRSGQLDVGALKPAGVQFANTIAGI
jgi:hypothetical protein